ncbi:hypothetical protein [Rhizobium leguminosarum]|uniref:hypothetical protein n=1 Tax=Rhizobium leguminosarum TaxID=384 RepID=UPI002E105562|nr:hypothetical protein U8Q02_41250 [Rhizobium leguminosarum]
MSEAIEVNSAREIGRRIYEMSLGDRRGFHGDDIDADVWEEIFEDVGTVALAEIGGNAISEDEKAPERTSHVVDWQTFTASSELATSGGVNVGFAGRGSDESYYWEITAVFMRHHGRQDGRSSSMEEARLQLEENWRIWLDNAGLAPRAP